MLAIGSRSSRMALTNFGQAVSVAGQFAGALIAEVIREMVLGLGVVGNAPQTVKDNVFSLTGDFDTVVVTPP